MSVYFVLFRCRERAYHEEESFLVEADSAPSAFGSAKEEMQSMSNDSDKFVIVDFKKVE